MGDGPRPGSLPLTVSFEIAVGDVWTDPEGVSWYVKSVFMDQINLERTVTRTVDAKWLVRNCKKLGEDDGA